MTTSYIGSICASLGCIPATFLKSGVKSDTKSYLNMMDQIPVEGLYALAPLIKSHVFYDTLRRNAPTYRLFKRIIHQLLSTDSLDL